MTIPAFHWWNVVHCGAAAYQVGVLLYITLLLLLHAVTTERKHELVNVYSKC